MKCAQGRGPPKYDLLVCTPSLPRATTLRAPGQQVCGWWTVGALCSLVPGRCTHALTCSGFCGKLRLVFSLPGSRWWAHTHRGQQRHLFNLSPVAWGPFTQRVLCSSSSSRLHSVCRLQKLIGIRERVGSLRRTEGKRKPRMLFGDRKVPPHSAFL